ncbi:E4 protein, partial [Felis domesticus papillomavirus 1]
QHLFPPVPPHPPDPETPLGRGLPHPPGSRPRNKRQARGEDLFDSPLLKDPDQEDSDEEEDEDKENYLPPRPGPLPPRLRKKLEKRLKQFQEGLQQDLGDFCSTLGILPYLF